MITNFFHFAALGMLLSTALNATPSPTPEQILADASRYTVKVQVLTEIGLNQDAGGSASGTGFLIDKKRGWLLTNAHVATRSPSTIRVSFRNGEEFEAKRIHVDPLIDLAVLVIPTDKIPSGAVEASLACDSLPTAGASVLAYGHPWGMSYTASRGIVAGLAWMYPSQFIQTDAVINSGNSGGPLISLNDGRVVGINTATYQPEEKDEGATAIGLAEPMPGICKIVDLLKGGKDTKLRLLPVAVATAGDDLRPRVAKVFQPGLQFQSGDIITAVNGGAEVGTFPELLAELRGLNGEAIISVERDGKAVNVLSSVKVVPDPMKVRSINFSGLIIGRPWMLDDFDVNSDKHLIVEWFEAAEEASLSGIAVADYIVSVDGHRFSELNALYTYLNDLPEDAAVEFMVKRRATAAEYFYEYHQISLARTKLGWVNAE
ncbi:DegQ Trypsin-like serine proteases, typically periplasmic, contain C-terminal PDZ domain [Sphingomonadaceae bacterium]